MTNHNPEEDKQRAGFSAETPKTEQLSGQIEVEKQRETSSEQAREQKAKSTPSEKGRFTLPKLRPRSVIPPLSINNQQVPKIEKIMESGLLDAYSKLSPIAKQEFRLKGEQTAFKINELLQKTHVKIKKILKLILDWLKLLPGVNRFFLEQEAKIKTDQILSLKNKK